MADSLNNFFSKANDKVQALLPNILGINPPMGGPNHRGRYFGPVNKTGISRSDGLNYKENPNPSQGQIVPLILKNNGIPVRDSSTNFLPGFTPIGYYTKNYQTFKGKVKAIRFVEEGEGAASGYSLKLNQDYVFHTSDIFRDNLEKYDKVAGDFKFGLQNNSNIANWPDGSIPTDPQKWSGLHDSRSSWTGRNELKPWLRGSHHNGGRGTPYENEDPVYFGFEIIINAESSPLFNGEIVRFLQTVGGTLGGSDGSGVGSDEVFNRKPILDSFCYEMTKYFKFKNGLGPYVTSEGSSLLDDEIFDFGNKKWDLYSSNLEKKHYVRKIENLDKLTEANTGKESNNSFVKYRTDLLKLTFYEDVTLSTGTLMNLYKLLYWSRSRGKNVIPENLLRFDCEIIVSEVRNISRIRTALDEQNSNSKDALQMIKENLSRYRYNVYECQFHMANLPHLANIDLSNSSVVSAPYDAHTIDISFKHSDVIFERFDYNNNIFSELNFENKDGFGKQNPKATTGRYFPLDSGLVVPFKAQRKFESNKLNIKTDPQTGNPSIDTRVPTINIQPVESLYYESGIIDGINRALKGQIDSSTSYSETIDALQTAKDNQAKVDFKTGLENATKNFAEAGKRIVINVAQQQLNDQFRLLNNTIDKVRNAYGLGRMSPPTNVYTQENLAMNQLRGAVRNFIGDVGSAFLDSF